MTIHDYTISVPFVLGKQRPRVTIHGTYTPARTRAAERDIAKAWRDVAHDDKAPAHVPVSVDIWTQRTLPVSRPKSTNVEADTYKSDADNICKLCLDALNDVAWADDAQVTELRVTKGNRLRKTEHDKTNIRVIWSTND